MSKCSTCGNEYDESFQVRKGEEIFNFDSLECAISKLAPQCHHCGMRMIGDGVHADSDIYFCANCAREKEGQKMKDSIHSSDAA